MLQSTAEELLQVFVKDKFEAMETIKGHILSKLNYFSETLLSNSATHSSSEAVELPSFTGTQLKSETMHMDPTTSTSNTGKGQLRKRLSLESAKRSHPMGMKRSRSNFDSVGQPSPKVARKSSAQTLVTSYYTTSAAGGETIKSTASTSKDDNVMSGDSQISKSAESQGYKGGGKGSKESTFYCPTRTCSSRVVYSFGD